MRLFSSAHICGRPHQGPVARLLGRFRGCRKHCSYDHSCRPFSFSFTLPQCSSVICCLELTFYFYCFLGFAICHLYNCGLQQSIYVFLFDVLNLFKDISCSSCVHQFIWVSIGGWSSRDWDRSGLGRGAEGRRGLKEGHWKPLQPPAYIRHRPFLVWSGCLVILMKFRILDFASSQVLSSVDNLGACKVEN